MGMNNVLRASVCFPVLRTTSQLFGLIQKSLLYQLTHYFCSDIYHHPVQRVPQSCALHCLGKSIDLSPQTQTKRSG